MKMLPSPRVAVPASLEFCAFCMRICAVQSAVGAAAPPEAEAEKGGVLDGSEVASRGLRLARRFAAGDRVASGMISTPALLSEAPAA